MRFILLICTIFIVNICFGAVFNFLPVADSEHHWIINTSNINKSMEYRDLLAEKGITLSIVEIDQDEILSDPLTVVAHKASQIGEGILVDDTSLDVEGEDVGVNLRWLIDDIPNYAGKKALWRVLLAYRLGNQVYVYSGEVKGVIVHPMTEDDSNLEARFLPDDSNYTLDLEKPDFLNPRALAVDALVNDEPIAVLPAIEEWDGPWQNQ